MASNPNMNTNPNGNGTNTNDDNLQEKGGLRGGRWRNRRLEKWLPLPFTSPDCTAQLAAKNTSDYVIVLYHFMLRFHVLSCVQVHTYIYFKKT